jgi:phage N-6-adenine-methyltransferase
MTIHTDRTIGMVGIPEDLTTTPPADLYEMLDTLVQSRKARNWDRSEQSVHHREYCDQEISRVKVELKRRGLRVSRPEPFDYDALDPETRIVVQQRTAEIREHMRRTAQEVVEIGIKLIEIKERLGHGHFLKWLEAEFQWTDRTAQNFMNVARRFKSETFSDLTFAPSVLYLLAAPSTPETAREEALDRAQAGEAITHSAARAIVESHKPPEPSTPGADPEQAEDEAPKVTVYMAGPTQPTGRVASVKARIAEAIRELPVARRREAETILSRYARNHPDDELEVVLGLVASGEFETAQAAIVAAARLRRGETLPEVERVGTDEEEEAQDRVPVSASPGYDGDEWYTPSEYVEAARDLMGAIDLDPASCDAAQEVVQAGTYYDKQRDGLKQPWFGHVWLNPPYSDPAPFTDAASRMYRDGAIDGCVILVNNATETGWFQRLLALYPACFLNKRISFWHPGRRSESPRQAQVVFYLGAEVGRFCEVFGGFGTIVAALGE